MAARGWIAAAVLALVSVGVRAQAPTVSAVQFPAWIERGGNAAPLTPGVRLLSGDRLRTGTNARIELKLPEGSTVKLGENAQFVIERIDQHGLFRAALRVVSGAFRFTTQALRKTQHRDISVRLRNVTAGIRGTDLWGRSNDDADLVCLLEGRIEVGSEGHPVVTLDEPRAFYVKPVEGEPKVDRVDEAQIKTWSATTEIEPGAAWARAGGNWRVIASKFEQRDAALALMRALRQRGYPAHVVDEEATVFLVRIDGLAGETEARALMAQLRDVPGVRIPSVQPVQDR